MKEKFCAIVVVHIYIVRQKIKKICDMGNKFSIGFAQLLAFKNVLYIVS